MHYFSLPSFVDIQCSEENDFWSKFSLKHLIAKQAAMILVHSVFIGRIGILKS